MNSRIFGFQRVVWWPKCTPASQFTNRYGSHCLLLLFALILRAIFTTFRHFLWARRRKLNGRVCFSSGALKYRNTATYSVRIALN